MNTPRRSLRQPTVFSAWALAALMLAVLAPASADPTLSLRLSPGAPARGGVIDITLRMSDLGADAAAGFQAFLEFDPAEIALLHGSYSAAPFGLPVITPIESANGRIDLAGGINPLMGQAPTLADADLVVLRFEVLQAPCAVRSLRFREHQPPTRLATLAGLPIEPLQLIDLPAVACPADIEPAGLPNGQVNVDDLLTVINAWGLCPAASRCCADIVPNQAVDVADLLAVIRGWGDCL